MDESIRIKIDRVLSRVKDPQSLLPVRDLGWVRRVQYLPEFDKLEVETDINPPRLTCTMCGLITDSLRQTIHRLLEEELQKEFPTSNVVVYQPGIE
ncbi:MAG: hypothetical protein SNJ78_10500 [Spirochaetales bacterium]